MKRPDVIIIGGGIIGLATAYHLTGRNPGTRVMILEKEAGPARHQTGHNSGVLHSGIYYRPGSLKASNCREGKRAMEAFCEAEGIPYDVCGKVIVAVDEAEVPTMTRIYQRGQENGVQCQIIDQGRLRQLEPHVAGVAAIHVPEAGIVDYPRVCDRLQQILLQRDGQFVTQARVTQVVPGRRGIVVHSTAGSFETDYAINCAGLHCDRVARMSGGQPGAKIVPFRGEYYKLKDGAKHLCRNLIYPVPDPNFPFLGVHFTRMIDGSVECGPNAVPALAREGYRRRDVNLRDMAESLTYPGFWRLAARYWRTGCGEIWRSLSKRAFVKALQRLVPEIRCQHLDSAPAGVRAQAVTPDGAMVDDFLITRSQRVIHVNNAPSPAATSSLNIGKLVVDQLDQLKTQAPDR